MSNSDLQTMKTAFCLLLAATSAMSADVTMREDGKLSGEVSEIGPDGVITLLSPVSGKPLLLKGDQVEKVVFSRERSPKADDESAQALPDQRLELTNGDILPVKVSALDDGLLHVESPVLGELAVPRQALSSLQLGIVPEKVIFAGIDGLDGWESAGGDRSWEGDSGDLTSTGQGIISRDVGLPEKFILSYALSWQNHANFQLRFCESANAPGERYVVEFSGSGLGVFRESASRPRSPIILHTRGSDRFSDNTLDVEIRMDRARGSMELRLNGQLLGRFTDSQQPVPSGGGVSLQGRGTRESWHRISGLRVLEWDDRGDRHRGEERGDGKDDSLIGRYGERFGGTLDSIRRDGASAVYVFKSDFQKEPLELPEEEVSTVFFRGGGISRTEETGDIIVNLRGGGTMRVSSCTLNGDGFDAAHPLLGQLKFDKSGVDSLERIWIPKANPVSKPKKR